MVGRVIVHVAPPNVDNTTCSLSRGRLNSAFSHERNRGRNAPVYLSAATVGRSSRHGFRERGVPPSRCSTPHNLNYTFLIESISTQALYRRQDLSAARPTLEAKRYTMSVVNTSAFGQNPGSGGVAQLGGTGTTAKLFVQANNSAAPFVLQPPIDVCEGRQIYIRAGGRLFVHGASPTVVTSLYGVQGGVPASAPTTATSYTSLASQSAQALTTAATYPWSIEAILQGDSKSGILQGAFRVACDNVVTAWAALSSTLTGVLFNSSLQGPGSGDTAQNAASAPPFTLVLGVTFAVSDSLNTANLNQFELEC